MVSSKTELPSLQSGDRLTREEFHRRYAARPDIRRAELIDGVVYVASPTRFSLHDEPAGAIVFWLFAYAGRHPDVKAGGSATLFLGEDEVQPDAFLFRVDPAGRGPRENAEGYLEGAPQLVVEVAASSVSYDLGTKLGLYLRSGVREYIVWRVPHRAIDWFRLRDGEYVRVEPNGHGTIESEPFPGLRLDIPKMLAGDTPACWPRWRPRRPTESDDAAHRRPYPRRSTLGTMPARRPPVSSVHDGHTRRRGRARWPGRG